ncbi:MAG: hypothetical protein A2287_08345 [Candidatus Melainabacteria bacterium RIFOXYA12_FULL_32_12]|nr:MAG: hypothetical protein A2255_06620 [Candidatus Melainabacteria bacterium RIFOXYA2_FULL_32_9]OGI26318.1 MAG: hypothetical protein A2287_08345 [Candidatus Melainabacteria bacterium RIFOXYA12_FULL_32_12]
MTQNYLLIFTFEIVIFYFIVYSLVKANRWVNDKQRYVDEISIDLPELIKQWKKELEAFNQKVKSQFNYEPLSTQEIGFLAGNIITDILTSRIPIFPFKNKFVVFSVFMKLWKYRHRIQATIATQPSRTVF